MRALRQLTFCAAVAGATAANAQDIDWQKVDAAIAQAKQDGTLNTMSKKWFGAPLPADL